MKIWISKNSEVPVRDQIVTQITLGITSGDLPIGSRLPSTQEVARRFRIHANTVSNAYRNLASDGWIEFRTGSGFFVRDPVIKKDDNFSTLDSLISELFSSAEKLGISVGEVRARLRRYVDPIRAGLVLIESDTDFREILLTELRDRFDLQITGIGFDDFKESVGDFDGQLVAMSDERERINAILPENENCLYLRSSSIPAALSGEIRPANDAIIAVVSGWQSFLELSKTILLAAQVEPESLLIRSTKQENWKKGLSSAAMIICDNLTAKRLNSLTNIRAFPLVSEESLREIALMIES